ncbi:MAG: quinolinate synthase NadA [Nitrospirota bacterium]|nr:quinolinate synthase NadA [Nitrospirota bacterium]
MIALETVRAPARIAFEEYISLPEAEVHARIRAARAHLGRDLVILGHHYQRDEVIQHADIRGDSLKLARQGVATEGVRHMVFCGVHFMAETADILSADDVSVTLPDLAAGCSMADMADLPSVTTCREELEDVLGGEAITPITYINSGADLKAFCGEHGGIVCTSSNARRILEWAFERSPRVLFFPDQHLGRNTALDMGIPPHQVVLWDPSRELGGNSEQALREARVILWAGHCSVHQMFLPEHVDRFRASYPGIRVIVHPECTREVVEKSDLSGSTEAIIRAIHSSPKGTRWVVGTELNLVNRIAREAAPDHEVHFLSPTYCVCSTMNRIDPPHLLWSLENLVAGAVVNRIRVPQHDREWARVALERMLALG